MKTLGLDLGTNSVGWALVDDHTPGERPTIACGVYVFPEAIEEQKDGHYHTHRHERGQKRRMRRNFRRKRQRQDQLLRLLLQQNMLPADAEERRQLFCRHVAPDGREAHPYALRKRGLDEPLTLHELGRALYHICRRRGYLSTARLKVRELAWLTKAAESTDAPDPAEDEEPTTEAERKEKVERSVLLARIRQIRDRLKQGGARTIGEFHANILAEGGYVRGLGGKRLARLPADAPRKKDPLGARADRALFEDEFNNLWERQAEFHSALRSPGLKVRVYNAIFHQRPLKRQTHLVGRCEFFPQRRRIPRATLLCQRTTILQYLNTIRLINRSTGEVKRLDGDQISRLADALDRRDRLSWKQARALLGLDEELVFSDEREEHGQGAKRRGKSVRGRDFIQGNKTAAAMRRAIGKAWDDLDGHLKIDKHGCVLMTRQEDLVTRLITCQEFKNVAKGLRRDFGFDDRQIYALATAQLPDGYGNHCHHVQFALERYLREGLDYSEACVEAGYRAPNESTEPRIEAPVDRLTRPPDVRNPIVQRSVQAAFRVINAVLDKHAKPDQIRIELPRDITRTNKQREELWKRQEENARARGQAAEKLRERGFVPTEINIKKYRLWKEAGCCCPYFPDQPVTLPQLINEYDIDHIVPRSRCFDDSWGNLTICPSAQNAVKTNQTPYEAWGRTNPAHWERIRIHLARLKTIHPKKRERILKESWDDTDFTNRALSDTRYISRLVLQEVKKLGVPVEVSRGQLTGLLLSAWKLGGVVPRSEDEEREQELRRRDRAGALSEEEQKELAAARRRRTPKPRSDHRHHALDAILTALTDPSTLQLLRPWLEEQERRGTRKDLPKPKPWPTIDQNLKQAIESCPVVFAPSRGISGPLHEETARKPPPQEQVDAALASLPANQRERVRRCIVVGKQLVWLDENGKAAKAYNLKSNHHAVIWEPLAADKRGEHVRELEVVTMIEASRRASCGEPVIRKQREGYRYVLSLCENDVVEWVADSPVLMRVRYLTAEPYWEVGLQPMNDAVADNRRRVRIRSGNALKQIRRRVVLSAIGEEIGSEPAR